MPEAARALLSSGAEAFFLAWLDEEGSRVFRKQASLLISRSPVPQPTQSCPAQPLPSPAGCPARARRWRPRRDDGAGVAVEARSGGDLGRLVRMEGARPQARVDQQVQVQGFCRPAAARPAAARLTRGTARQCRGPRPV